MFLTLTLLHFLSFGESRGRGGQPARQLGHVGVGLIFPWAGATSATAFAAGEVGLARMIWIGLAATVVLIVLVATIHLMMAPLV